MTVKKGEKMVKGEKDVGGKGEKEKRRRKKIRW
jgi:ribosome-associated protein YbcJ (S4-like RNA binding protein)